ncbi:RodZ domain-containing protein [Desulfosporosinus sp. FKB]|uniref:helix-turn-helix domain-containing protein n=1 Tax=Desulfosporosinus sp. FKB TaxID=1969835 RepID=UPI000B49D898|nr:RodZ domain-containing protein [Desulfosporosinus sp. FKB]
MAGEGQMLRAAREEKQWSLRFTEDTTKIRVRYIQALEEENYGILPGTTYVKGYLRTYAKHLGLNPDEIIQLYNNSPDVKETVKILETPDHIPLKKSPNWVRPLAAGIMAILAIGIVVGVAEWSHNTPEKPSNSAYSPSALPSAPSQAEAAASKQNNAQSNSKNNTQNNTKNDQNNSQASSTPPSVLAATQDGLTAQLEFKQSCWVVVQADGQPVFQGTFAAGTTKVVKGSNKIELVTVGNAGGLNVTLNGKALPSLGSSGQVIRNVIFTPETLKTL